MTNWKACTTLIIVVDVHMILYTLWYFFLMTLLMNKFTSIVIPTCFQFIHNPQNLIPLQGYWSSSCSCYMLALAHPLCCSMMHEAHTNFWNKLWYILHPNIYVMEYCHRWLKFGYEIAYQVLVFATLYIYNTWRKNSQEIQLVLSKRKELMH